MARSTSEIFELYAKEMEKQGLIKTAAEAEKESKEMKKYKSDPKARNGSDDISTIELLYGVKPESIYEYERNIAEFAHKEPYIVGPAYDRLNTLVENVNERNDIMCNIVMKDVNGNLTQHRYASKELMMELIRIANDMDNRDNQELRALADSCIEDLKKNAISLSDVGNWFSDEAGDIGEAAGAGGHGALLGAAIGGLLGGLFGEGIGAIPGAKLGALIGGSAGTLAGALFKTSPQASSISENVKDVLNQLNDLKVKLPSDQFIILFEKELNTLADLASQYSNTVDVVRNKVLEKQDTNGGEISAAKQTSVQMMDQINKVEVLFGEFNKRAKGGEFSAAVSHDKLLTPMYWFVDNDVEDVSKSITALDQSIRNFRESVRDLGEQTNQVVASAQNDSEKINMSPVADKEKQPLYRNQTPQFEEGNEDLTQLVKFLGHQPNEREMEFFKSLKENG